MSIVDVLTYKRQPKKDETYVSRPDDPVSVARTLNESFDVHEQHPGEKTPGELWARQIMEQARLKGINDREMNRYPLLNMVKRGKLGLDLYLIIFALSASIALPFYFWNKMKKNRAKIIESRGINPDLIQYLNEDSAVNIDDVSYSSYHYENPKRAEEMDKHVKNIRAMEILEKDLSEM